MPLHDPRHDASEWACRREAASSFAVDRAHAQRSTSGRGGGRRPRLPPSGRDRPDDAAPLLYSARGGPRRSRPMPGRCQHARLRHPALHPALARPFPARHGRRAFCRWRLRRRCRATPPARTPGSTTTSACAVISASNVAEQPNVSTCSTIWRPRRDPCRGRRRFTRLPADGCWSSAWFAQARARSASS